MNKARRKLHRKGIAKRLANGSFILSCTRKLSSRIVRFFEKGAASPLLASVEAVDGFVTDKITDPIGKQVGVRKNFVMPIRNAIASFFNETPFFKKLSQIRTAFLKTSVRSVGLFLLTFGIYSLASFFVNRFVAPSIGTDSISDFSVAAVTVVAGIMLSALGDKSIVSTVGSAGITGTLLLNYLGVNRSVFERYPSELSGSAPGISIIIGSLAGVTTLFFRPLHVMLFLVVLTALIVIFHIPEFGLLSAIFTFSFVRVEFTAVLIVVTLLSFLLKCLRLKRNFRFGTADAAMAVLLSVMFIHFAVSDGAISGGEAYILCFSFVYFLAKNLLCSENLVFQAFKTLCVGLSFGMALYILGKFFMFIPHVQVQAISGWLTKNTLSPGMLFTAVAILLPFACFSFTSFGWARPNTWFIILSLASAVVTDSFLPFLLLLISFFVFIAIITKSPVGSMLGALIVLPPSLSLIAELTSSSTVTAGKSVSLDKVLSIEGEFSNFWSSFSNATGVITAIVFVAVLLLIIQRVFGCTVINRSSRSAVVCGTLAASVTMFLVCSFMFNPLSDLRVFAVIWFVLGLCGSVYKVCSAHQNADWEV